MTRTPLRHRRHSNCAAARTVLAALVALLVAPIGLAQRPSPRVRARDLGITIGTMTTGPLNAITDVTGVLVGHSTIVRGSGALRVGKVRYARA